MKYFKYPKCALPNKAFPPALYVRNNPKISWNFLSFLHSLNPMRYRCSTLHDFRSMGIVNVGKRVLLSFILDTHKNLQEGTYLKARFLSVVPSWIWHKLKKPHFSRKKKCACPQLHPFTPITGVDTENRQSTLRDLLSFTFLVKREEHSVFPKLHTQSIFSVLKEGKEVTGAIDLRAFNSVIIRQNVCLGGKYIIALVNLLFKQLKHTHKA